MTSGAGALAYSALARSVAEELDGELAIESSAVGTLASLRLPLAVHEAADGQSPRDA